MKWGPGVLKAKSQSFHNIKCVKEGQNQTNHF